MPISLPDLSRLTYSQQLLWLTMRSRATTRECAKSGKTFYITLNVVYGDDKVAVVYMYLISVKIPTYLLLAIYTQV